MEGTCSSTYDAPATQSADIPSTSHSFTYAFPSMHHHLACCFNYLSAEEQLAVKEALQRCDEEVSNLTLRISSAQMSAIQQIKRILCDGQPRTQHPPPPDGRSIANHVTTPSVMQATHRAPNMEAARQRQHLSPHVADGPNVLLHEGRDIEEDTNDRNVISHTHVAEGDGFDKWSSSRQDTTQSLYSSPHESPYDSPHEILTNGVCKTCYDINEMCKPDEELHDEEEDADPSAANKATLEKGNELSGLRPQVDAAAVGQITSPRTPHFFRPMRNIVTDSSFHGLHTEFSQSSPLPPPVFDKSANSHQDSLTPSVDGTEHVTQSWEVSQQLRDAGIQKIVACTTHPYLRSPRYDSTPRCDKIPKH